MKQSELRKLLGEGIVEVQFTKKDGTERTIMCSTNPSYMPEFVKKEKTPRKMPEGHMTVVDTDLMEFRSFNYDQVNTYKFVL